MYVVRCKSAISGNWTTHFYETLDGALYYFKVTKGTKAFCDDTLYLTRENAELTTIYSGQNAPEIWRIKD